MTWKRFQAGCLPVRGFFPNLEVLLITSRFTGEWIPPKGNVEHGESVEEAALRETEEEAGVVGRLGRRLGCFEFLRGQQKVSLEMFILEVEEQKSHWPEKDIRRRKWFKINDALQLVRRPEVRSILLSLLY